jgi:B-cell receptor-associated protein 31
MIQLLFVVLVCEAAVAVTLLFKTPLRKLAVLALDRLKRGRGAPVAVKTVAGVVLTLLASTLYSMAEISGRVGDPESGGGGALSPTDQVLFSRHLLEASLMGRSLLVTHIPTRSPPSSTSLLFPCAFLIRTVSVSAEILFVLLNGIPSDRK